MQIPLLFMSSYCSNLNMSCSPVRCTPLYPLLLAAPLFLTGFIEIILKDKKHNRTSRSAECCHAGVNLEKQTYTTHHYQIREQAIPKAG